MNGSCNVDQAVILVGGRGTRLGNLTRTSPKPLIPVAGRPFLDWLIDEVARFGISRITLLAGYLGKQIVVRYDGQKVRGSRIEVVIEPEPLGTAGGLRLFAGKLAPQFLVMNGDTRFDVNLLDLKLHSGDAVGTLALRHTAQAERYGTVKLQEDGTITDFLAPAAGREGLINGGIYLFDRRLMNWIGGGSVSMESEIFPRLATARLLRGAVYDGQFIDIGIPVDLARGQTEIPAMVRRPAVFLERDNVLIERRLRRLGSLEPNWVAGASAAVKRLNDSGYLVFVVTDRETVEREGRHDILQQWMVPRLAALGAHIDAFIYRPPTLVLIQDLCASWSVQWGRSFQIRSGPGEAATATGLSSYRFSGGDLSMYIEELLRTVSATAS